MRPLNSLGFQVPASGRISSPFGPRKHPVTGELDVFHNGIDIAAPEGTPVMAAKEGVIESVNENSPTAGKVIYVRHNDGTQSRYMHLSKILISKVGLRVYGRTVIGLVGHTGKVTGDHLHFEVRSKDGVPLDPGALWGMTTVTHLYPSEKDEDIFNVPLTGIFMGALAIFAILFWGYT